MEFYACDKPKKSRGANLIIVQEHLISTGKTKTAVKCTLTFPNLTTNQLVGVKQLRIKEVYSIIFNENANKYVLFLIKLRWPKKKII